MQLCKRAPQPAFLVMTLLHANPRSTSWCTLDIIYEEKENIGKEMPSLLWFFLPLMKPNQPSPSAEPVCSHKHRCTQYLIQSDLSRCLLLLFYFIHEHAASGLQEWRKNTSTKPTEGIRGPQSYTNKNMSNLSAQHPMFKTKSPTKTETGKFATAGKSNSTGDEGVAEI